MKINGDVSSLVRASSNPLLLAGDESAKKVAPSAVKRETPRDGVELSAEGLALSKGSELTPERIDEVRQRILQGAYNQTDIINEVAKRIVRSGDL